MPHRQLTYFAIRFLRRPQYEQSKRPFAVRGISEAAAQASPPTAPGRANGTLTFDSVISATFVIGLKASTQYNYYCFNAMTPVSSLTFNSTASVAKNNSNVPQNLPHASLYYGPVTPVPELETYALMLGGIGALAFVSKRCRSSVLKTS